MGSRRFWWICHLRISKEYGRLVFLGGIVPDLAVCSHSMGKCGLIVRSSLETSS